MVEIPRPGKILGTLPSEFVIARVGVLIGGVMARIRSIKPEFWTSEQIVECSTRARLLFIGLWSFADDAGCHPASLKRLKMEVFPGDNFTDKDVAGMVAELVSHGLLREYEAQGQSYWEVTGWKKHQKIDRPTIKYPGPLDEGSTNGGRLLDEGSPPEGRGEEGKKKVKKESTPTKRFVKPTLLEVTAYCRERKNGINPQNFIDSNEAKGWVVGTTKTPMKNWKAVIHTWEHNRQEKQAGTEETPPI